MVQSQPSPDQSSASCLQPSASGSGKYWVRPSGDFLTDQLVQISMETARRYTEAQAVADDDDDDDTLPPSIFTTPLSSTALVTLTPPHSVPSTTPPHSVLPASAHRFQSPASRALFST